jgi:DNA repair protein RadC
MTYQIISERTLRNPCTIESPEDSFQLLKRYANSKQEQFIIITLDNDHTPLRIIILSIGTVNRTLTHCREIFYHAIKDLSTAIILCHNHPAGSLIPSKEDFEFTAKAIEASKIIGISILDHLIINKKKYFSFLEEDIITKDHDYIKPSNHKYNAEWHEKYVLNKLSP